MPPLNKRVLVFDNQLKLWKIGRLEEKAGQTWWVLDPHIYFAVGDRFTKWQDLPGDPT